MNNCQRDSANTRGGRGEPLYPCGA